MNPIDPLRPASLDDLVGHVDPSPAYGSYGPASSYAPYHWEMPWVPTPQPTVPRFDEPRPELPPLPPRYEDGLLTREFFTWAMQNLDR